MFTEWAGVSPKKFLQYTSIQHAKLLLQARATISDTAFETGLSGTGRLHDLFVQIEGMTPGEFKDGGRALTISYGFSDSIFGNMLIAATPTGICHIAFADDEPAALQLLMDRFPNAQYRASAGDAQLRVADFFLQKDRPEKIKLHLRGTPFQLKVWETLLKIPAGNLVSYATVAQAINQAGSSRAVGSAIGANPVALLIPCHRVIQSTGAFGDYHWGQVRKKMIIGWEAARLEAAAALT